jgi:hypothetical protein
MNQRRLEMAMLIDGLVLGRESGDLERTLVEFESSHDELLREATHLVRHFAADADIRNRDEAYAMAQKASLEKMVNRLRRDIAESK